MRASRPLRPLGLLLVLGALSACSSGSGGGGAAVDPNAPVISNLRVSFGGRCSLPSGLPGTIEIVAFDFADADGNVRGGTVENTVTAPVGAPLTFIGGIPSSPVAITGPPTSGTISITGCLRFGSNATITERVKVTDASGKTSNELALDVARPAGAPLLPQGADPDLRKSL